MPAIEYREAGEALNRLIKIAEGDSGSERRVAEFLLAWWDGMTGLISMADLCCLDPETRKDILTIIAYITQNGITYAYAWDRRADMVRLYERLRPAESD